MEQGAGRQVDGLGSPGPEHFGKGLSEEAIGRVIEFYEGERLIPDEGVIRAAVAQIVRALGPGKVHRRR